MKRFAALLSFLIIVSFLAACVAAPDKRGYGGKKSIPKQAQEEVVQEK
ncbi:MAG: hypothetical protein PHY31_08875 [Smithellaceae bacterium]|nr:hypothetical protein [Smithellaceae bacterium]